jgi:hypothetical protein
MISPNTTGLDVKYNGYSVLAPSPHCAGKPTPVPTGKFYKWLPGKDPFENDFLMPYLPAWIVARTDLGKLAMVGVRQSDDDIYGTGKCGLGIKHIRGLLRNIAPILVTMIGLRFYRVFTMRRTPAPKVKNLRANGRRLRRAGTTRKNLIKNGVPLGRAGKHPSQSAVLLGWPARRKGALHLSNLKRGLRLVRQTRA